MIIAVFCLIFSFAYCGDFPIGYLFTYQDCHVRYYDKSNHVGYYDKSNYIQSKNHLFNVYEKCLVDGKWEWLRVDKNWWVYHNTQSDYYDAIHPPAVLISDSDFTWQDYTLEDVKTFFRSLKYNRFTDKQIEMIYNSSKSNKISFLVVAAKLEQETSLTLNIYSAEDYNWRMNRAMGYFLQSGKTGKDGVFRFPYSGFDKQIGNGVACLRYWYDRYKPGHHVKLVQLNLWHKVGNAATYALYLYCPHYGYCNDGRGEVSMGNYNFIKYYSQFAEIYRKIKKSY